MKLILEISDVNLAFAKEFFNSISFVKTVKTIVPNEITNVEILQEINNYEAKKSKPTPLNLVELKAMINA